MAYVRANTKACAASAQLTRDPTTSAPGFQKLIQRVEAGHRMDMLACKGREQLNHLPFNFKTSSCRQVLAIPSSVSTACEHNCRFPACLSRGENEPGLKTCWHDYAHFRSSNFIQAHRQIGKQKAFWQKDKPHNPSPSSQIVMSVHTTRGHP